MSDDMILDDELRAAIKRLGWRVMHRRDGQYWLMLDYPYPAEAIRRFVLEKALPKHSVTIREENI